MSESFAKFKATFSKKIDQSLIPDIEKIKEHHVHNDWARPKFKYHLTTAYNYGKENFKTLDKAFKEDLFAHIHI